MWHQLLQIKASSPVCVGAVGAVMIAVIVCGMTSLLLEDAAVSTVEFCCTEAVSALPLTNWLRFFWAVWRSVMVLGAVGVGWAVSSLGICCRNSFEWCERHRTTKSRFHAEFGESSRQLYYSFFQVHIFMQFICRLHKATAALLSDCKNEGGKDLRKNICRFILVLLHEAN